MELKIYFRFLKFNKKDVYQKLDRKQMRQSDVMAHLTHQSQKKSPMSFFAHTSLKKMSYANIVQMSTHSTATSTSSLLTSTLSATTIGRMAGIGLTLAVKKTRRRLRNGEAKAQSST